MVSSRRKHADVIIIGAGMGGMCAAAHLVAAGLSVLVLEKSPYLGGRCSHRVRDGFTITTGAIMIPMGANSAIRQSFDAVGVGMDMVETTGRMRYRLAHGDYDLPPSGGGLLGMMTFAFEGNETKAKALFQHFREALGELPPEQQTFRHWLQSRCDNPQVINLFQGFCAALMGTNLHEIPAAEFFRFLRHSSHGSRFGLAAHGNGSLMEALAEGVTRLGGEIRTHTRCEKILVNDGKTIGVETRRTRGERETLYADYVISNTGPERTIRLTGEEALFDGAYREQLQLAPHDAPIIHYSFVCQQPLIQDLHGSLVFGNTRNLIYLEIPSLISPALAPDGWYLHTAYGAPADAANADLNEEARNTLQELEDNFPGLQQKARFLVKARHSGQSPGMHRWPGHMMPVTTPVINLFNVGDGVTSPGTIGTEGAASSGRQVAGHIISKI